MTGYLYLACAIVLELAGTMCLKYSHGFEKLLPTVGTVVFYISCFFFLSMSLKTINLSIAYATWCGIGIVAAGLISFFIFGEKLSLAGIGGMILVVSGVIIMNLYGTAH